VADQAPTRPTIHDVARVAGVSVTTVSHALNGKGRVDPATRSRVALAVRQLGYRANHHARGLRSGKTGSLGLLLPVTGDVRPEEALSLDFYMRLTSAAAAAAFSREYALMLLPSTIAESGLTGIGIDGGIVVDPSPADQRVNLLLARGLPVVTIERDHGRPEDPWYVTSATDATTWRMLDHLAKRGAQRIAVLVPEPGWGWGSETLSAYTAWADERAVPRLAVPVSMMHGERNAFNATRRLLTGAEPPDAIFADAARFVRGVLRGAKAAGRKVPADLLIAAGVDTVAAREGDPPVTALDLHPERQAVAAVEMLVARRTNSPVQAPRHVPATLRPRASTDVPVIPRAERSRTTKR
jgi:DNA-binding LacI/PurR family transcriptional regulator